MALGCLVSRAFLAFHRPAYIATCRFLLASSPVTTFGSHQLSCSRNMHSNLLFRNMHFNPLWPNQCDLNTFCRGAPAANSRQSCSPLYGFVEATQTAIKKTILQLGKAFIYIIMSVIVIIAGIPSFTSWQTGKNTILFIANQAIPGSLSVEAISLGWARPIQIQGITLQCPEGKRVLSIPELTTKAPLWSIVIGKSGLGDCSIVSPVVDIQEEQTSGIPHLVLALVSSDVFLKSKQRAQHKKRKQLDQPLVTASFTCNLRAANGSLEITNGRIYLPRDMCATLGKSMFVDVLLGQLASAANEVQVDQSNIWNIPLQAKFWSECTYAEGHGFLVPWKKKIELIKPIKLEMALSPEFGQLYLSRVNPLLGHVVGPALREEDMPDVTIEVSPLELSLPSRVFKLHFEPLSAVLARGPLVEGIFAILKRDDLLRNKGQIVMQTAAMEVNIDTEGFVTCSRADILVQGNVHIATWGTIDLVEETVKMVFAIPSATLTDILGFKKIPKSYYLQIPVGGTFERPQIDVKSAGIGIAQLALYERGGHLVSSFLQSFDASKGVPMPTVSSFPWSASNSSEASQSK